VSPSWNSLATPLRTRPPVGLALGRTSLAAAQMEPTRGQWRLLRTVELPLARPLFEGPANAAARGALADALHQLRDEWGRAACTAQVSLPDPVVSLRVFALERLPASRRLQAELVRWRFAREFACPPEQMACAHQVYEQQGGRPSVLGLAMAADWAALVREACRSAGIIVTAMDMDGCHRHNRLRARICQPGRPGVLLALQPWSWALSAWDAAGRLCFVRARWIGAANLDAVRTDATQELSGDEAETVAQETQRVVRSHAQSQGTSEPLTVCVAGPAGECERMAERLDRHLRETCKVVPNDFDLELPHGTCTPARSPASPAIAAAVPR